MTASSTAGTPFDWLPSPYPEIFLSFCSRKCAFFCRRKRGNKDQHENQAADVDSQSGHPGNVISTRVLNWIQLLTRRFRYILVKQSPTYFVTRVPPWNLTDVYIYGRINTVTFLTLNKPGAFVHFMPLMTPNRRLRPNSPSRGSDSGVSGLLNERILLLILQSIKWDLTFVCLTASLNQKLRAISKRLLWRELCLYRAPRMIATLTNGLPTARIGDGWHALAKLLFYCCGCESTRDFGQSPGHLAKASRFSKTSGRSFLTKKCRDDLLYVSDPCEHPIEGKEDDLGVYRGVFRGFLTSRTRAFLIRRRVDLDDRVRCPYCGARVWSMTNARMVPKSAARRLGSGDGGLEYFVCLNGHLHGTCWLAPLSSDEDQSGGDGEDDDCDDEHEDDDSRIIGVSNGSTSSIERPNRLI